MYLKSLELFGFKSFAQKTILQFHTGVTAVVGPNGCGKSNVLDAMRWVLGEQSAKALRGGEMADVIFNGTDSRAPVNTAEVSLTFADCEKDLGVEWNEVRITRRVHRDGGSEYLLNKTPCRLRDIHQLFMDTGIGRSAYSIMEQGRIDQILSSRPEDRRAVFEEAAGITKYKAQKKEALRKLEYTEANLVRITDIVREVKRQIGSLQRQAGKARRYQSLLEDLRTLDTHLSRKRIDEIDAEIREATTEIERLRGLQTSREDGMAAQEEELRTRRTELDRVENEIAAARQRVQELRSRIATATHRIEFNRERMTEAETLSDRYRGDIGAGEEKLRIQQGQIVDTDQQIAQLIETLASEEAMLGEQNARAAGLRASRTEAERKTVELANRSTELEGRIARLRAELGNVTQQRESGQTRLGVLEGDIRQVIAARTRVEEQTTATRTLATRGQATVEERRRELRDAEDALQAARTALEQTARSLTAAQRSHAEQESRLGVLRQLEAEGEGLNEGAQAILRGLDNPGFFRPAVLGALASLVEVQADSIPAVEAALGHHLQMIVLKDPAIAESVIDTLTSARLGRAVVGARGLIPAANSSQIQALPEGAIAWAADRVRVSEELAPLLHRLLEDVVIVPDLATALRLKPLHPDLGFASLRGDLLTREGVLSGGQNSANSQPGNSVLHRRLQIQELALSTEAARAEAARIESDRNERDRAVMETTRAVDQSREGLQTAQLELSTVQGQLSLLDRELREAAGRAETLDWEIRSVRENLEAAETRARELQTDTGSAEAEADRCREARSAAATETESLRASESELADGLNEIRIRVATSRQHRENLSRQRQPMAARVEELDELLRQRRGDIAGCADRTERLRAECATLAAEIEEAQRGEKEAVVAVEAVLEQRTALAVGTTTIEQNLALARRELAQVQERRGQLEVRSAQLGLKVDSLAEHVMRRYHADLRTLECDWYRFHCAVRDQRKRRARGPVSEPSPETAADPSGSAEPVIEVPVEAPEAVEAALAPDTGETIDWAFVESLVVELTDRLDAMGPVNLDAIQEFDELEERYRFLDTEHADLTKAKSDLLEVISRINRTTRDLFADTFEKVRVNFQEMFTELFGGGKANLILADEADPLESGIEIIARPPGKQLQSISLLSGGEKTMTAVALLFSIYMVKPSPFCVLDEMDAPLDESNITRFIKILDRFTSQSQFVVITHNKRTIARADVLYGVTMEEHGVSKLVGVKLTRREDAKTGTGDLMTANSSGGQGQGNDPESTPSIAESFGKHGNLHSETIAGGDAAPTGE